MKGSGKYWPLAALLLIPGFAGGATVVDSLAAVKSDLGDVRGSILTSRGRQVVYYNRGRVTLVGGQVKEVSLQDDEEIALAQERLRQAREASVKAAALRKEHRITRGMALKEGKLGDPVFLTSTPELRLRFWLDFMRIYPEVDVSQELQDALLAYQVFKSLREQEERIAEAEERARRGFSSASEYIRELIRRDQKEAAKEKLEALLIEGLESGEPIVVTEDYWGKKRQELTGRQRKKKAE